MATKLEPVPGCYYINLSDQLIKVAALLYHEGSLSFVTVEFLNGMREHILIEEWNHLDLYAYPDWLAQRREKINLQADV